MPAKRKSNSSNKRFLAVIGTIFIISILLAMLVQGKKPPLPTSSVTPSSQQMRTFTSSSAMGNFTITVPEGFEVEEKFGSVTLSKLSTNILIVYSGTNYESLQKLFYSDKDLKNRNPDYTVINGNEVATTIQDDRKSYYFYKNYALYSMSTTTTDLYPILDQIAQSFKIPDN